MSPLPARALLPRSRAAVLPRVVVVFFFLLVLLSPLGAYAEERDPAEIGHALAILGIITTLFLSCFSLSVWLLVMRLRDRRRQGPDSTAPAAAPAAKHPDLERLWFPAAPTKGKAG